MIETGFWFNEKYSKDLDLNIIRFESGLIPFNISGNRTINSTILLNNDVRQLSGITNEILAFQLQLTTFNRPIDDFFKDEVLSWLITDDYKSLFFDTNTNKQYNAIITGQTLLNFDTVDKGYFTINFETNSPWAHEPTKRFILNRNHASLQPLTIFNTSLPVNLYYPKMLVKNLSEETLKIQTESQNGKKRIFEFEDLRLEEEFYIDNQNHIILSNSENSFPYQRFNKNWLTLEKGLNTITLLEGDAEVIFECEFLSFSH